MIASLATSVFVADILERAILAKVTFLADDGGKAVFMRASDVACE
jgi:hypothetical protein